MPRWIPALLLATILGCGGEPAPTPPPAEAVPQAPAEEPAPDEPAAEESPAEEAPAEESPAEESPAEEASAAEEASPAEAPLAVLIPVPPKPKGDGTIPKAASDETARACEADADCAVTELVNGSCCNRGCGPSSAYNREFLAGLKAHNDAHCADRRAYECLAVACMWEAYHATCEEGRCVAARGAR